MAFLLVEVVGQWFSYSSWISDLKMNEKIETLIINVAKITEYILLLTMHDSVSLVCFIFFIVIEIFKW